MLSVLKVVPGVSDPTSGEATRAGVTRPFIQYHAAERYPGGHFVRFNLQQASGSLIWFVAPLSGMVGIGGSIDLHVTDSVIQKWKTKCGVDANVLFV